MEVHEIAIEEQKTFDEIGVFPLVLSPLSKESTSDQVCTFHFIYLIYSLLKI